MSKDRRLSGGSASLVSNSLNLNPQWCNKHDTSAIVLINLLQLKILPAGVPKERIVEWSTGVGVQLLAEWCTNNWKECHPELQKLPRSHSNSNSGFTLTHESSNLSVSGPPVGLYSKLCRSFARQVDSERKQSGNSAMNLTSHHSASFIETEYDEESRISDPRYFAPKPRRPSRYTYNSPSDTQLQIALHVGHMIMAIVLPAILFNVVVIPIEITHRGTVCPSVVSIVTDFLCCGVMYSAFTPFQIKGHYVKERKSIAKYYIRSGRAILDFTACFPVYLLMWDSPSGWNRVNRLLLVSYVPGMINSLATRIHGAVHPLVLRLINMLYVSFLIMHVSACSLHAVLEGDFTGANTWLGRGSLEETPPLLLYAVEVDWTLRMLLGRGSNYPLYDSQIGVSIVITMTGVALLTVLLAIVNDSVRSLDRSASVLPNKIDEVRDAMNHLQLPQPIQDETIRYYRQMWSTCQTFSVETQERIFDDLPVQLYERIQFQSYAGLIQKIPLFQRVKDNNDFVYSMIDALFPVVTIPGEPVVQRGEVGECMYFVLRGTLEVLDHDGNPCAVIREGGCFGENALLFGGVRAATIRTAEYCTLHKLHRDQFERLVDIFPEALFGILDEVQGRMLARDAEHRRKSENTKTQEVVTQEESAEMGSGRPQFRIIVDEEASVAAASSHASEQKEKEKEKEITLRTAIAISKPFAEGCLPEMIGEELVNDNASEDCQADILSCYLNKGGRLKSKNNGTEFENSITSSTMGDDQVSLGMGKQHAKSHRSIRSAASSIRSARSGENLLYPMGSLLSLRGKGGRHASRFSRPSIIRREHSEESLSSNEDQPPVIEFLTGSRRDSHEQSTKSVPLVSRVSNPSFGTLNGFDVVSQPNSTISFDKGSLHSASYLDDGKLHTSVRGTKLTAVGSRKSLLPAAAGSRESLGNQSDFTITDNVNYAEDNVEELLSIVPNNRDVKT